MGGGFAHTGDFRRKDCELPRGVEAATVDLSLRELVADAGGSRFAVPFQDRVVIEIGGDQSRIRGSAATAAVNKGFRIIRRSPVCAGAIVMEMGLMGRTVSGMLDCVSTPRVKAAADNCCDAPLRGVDLPRAAAWATRPVFSSCSGSRRDLRR
jgi:hypothetical protein